jgi:hypothetical protein
VKGEFIVPAQGIEAVSFCPFRFVGQKIQGTSGSTESPVRMHPKFLTELLTGMRGRERSSVILRVLGKTA